MKYLNIIYILNYLRITNTFMLFHKNYINKINISSQYIKKDTFKKYNFFIDNDFNNTISYIPKNKFLENKKIISISPAGYKGVYTMGVCNYIKKHYNLDNYVFSGASAGAWNALLLCYKKDSSVFKNDILHYGLNNSNNILELQLLMKKKLLEKYSINDFKINKLYIGVTTLQNFHPETIIYNDFKSLEDAIDCCIASSYIPFITGEMINKYHNLYSFDGGFSKHPYLDTKANLHITPDIWSQNKVHNETIFDMSLFYKNKYNFTRLYKDGYNDSHNNKKILDSVFIKH